MTSVAAPDVAGHDAPEAGDRRGRVLRRCQLLDVLFGGQQSANRRLELPSGRGLLSHFGSFSLRFAVPLTIRHSVNAMIIAAKTTTIRYGIHESEPSKTLN